MTKRDKIRASKIGRKECLGKDTVVAQIRAEKHIFLLKDVLEESCVILCMFEGTPGGEEYARKWAKHLRSVENNPPTVELVLTINLICPDKSDSSEYPPGRCEVLQRWRIEDGVWETEAEITN